MITDKLSIGYIVRKWLFLLGVAIIAFFFSSYALAQEPSPSPSPSQDDPQVRAKIYGVEFPIADLGNCGSYNECRSFCEDPVNGKSCIDYGKSKGFYKDDPVILEKDKILGEAKKRLGCDSYEACLNFCEVPANLDACNSFAKSQGIPAGVVNDPGRREIITKAKEVLGCDSADSCQAFCLQQDNISKCKSFAEEVGLRGGEHRVGPGGCQSEGTCKSFCSDPNNFQVCKGFTEVSGGTFRGPGGCNSAEGCFTYCQQNPANCGYREGEDPGKGIAPGGGFYNPIEMCNRTPNCSWAGSSCSCGYYGETKETVQKAAEYAAYCKANLDKCPEGRQPEIFGNSEKRQEFEDFCKTNPDKCRPPAEQASTVTYGRYGGYYYGAPGNVGVPDPAAECGRYGCSWSGSSCDCSSVSQDSPALACGRQAGCSWINASCQCQGTSGQGSGGYPVPAYVPGGSGSGYSGRDPAADCGRAPGCSWNGSSCQCSTTPQSGYRPPTDYPRPSGYSGSSGYSGGGYTPPSGSYVPPPPGSYTPPSGGDSGGGGSAPAPAPVQNTAPAPQPEQQQQSQPAPQPAPQEPAPAPAAPAPAPVVQGVAAVRSVLDRILDFFR